MSVCPYALSEVLALAWRFKAIIHSAYPLPNHFAWPDRLI